MTEDDEYLLELIRFDEEHGDASGVLYSSATARRSPTLAELWERFGGDTGGLTDPAGHEHFVNLSWPKYHPQTRLLIRWHRVGPPPADVVTEPPVRDGYRDGSDAPGRPPRPCPMCGSPVLRLRARYCSDACKHRAFRSRHNVPPQPPAKVPKHLVVYQCDQCEGRLLGDQRCPDCGVFCRRLGPGALCPCCDEPIAVAELLEP